MWSKLMVLFAVLLLASGPVSATAGFAEWEIETPGGNTIGSMDPYKLHHGTCLLEGKPGTHGRADVIIPGIEWWQYWNGRILGQNAKGYFLFDEKSKAVTWFDTERDLRNTLPGDVTAGTPSKRMTPDDGYDQVWRPIYRERCKNLRKDDPAFAGLEPAILDRIEATCKAIESSK
jgi:hypothetical protein